jgi:hypothetical protein
MRITYQQRTELLSVHISPRMGENSRIKGAIYISHERILSFEVCFIYAFASKSIQKGQVSIFLLTIHREILD